MGIPATHGVGVVPVLLVMLWVGLLDDSIQYLSASPVSECVWSDGEMELFLGSEPLLLLKYPSLKAELEDCASRAHQTCILVVCSSGFP